MAKIYEKAELEIVRFTSSDLIACSGGGGCPPEGGGCNPHKGSGGGGSQDGQSIDITPLEI